MALKLIVTAEFAGFKIGTEITDAKLMAEYAASHPSFVVKTNAPDAPPPPALPTA